MPKPASKPTMDAGYTRALLEYAVSRGADRRTLVERSGVCPDELGNRENRIPLAQCAALMRAAVVLCEDPAFALHFGEAVKTDDLSIVWLIAGAAETVGDARMHANRYARLLRDDHLTESSGLLTVIRDRAGTWLVVNGGNHSGEQYFIEAGISWCVHETRRMLAVHHEGRSFPKAIHFVHAEPSYRAEYNRMFNVPLVFGSNKNAMLVDDDFLALRMPPSNPYASQVFREHADALLKRLESSMTIRGRVESLLTANLGTGDNSLEQIARKMGLSRQTLARQLKSEGATFEMVSDQLRRRIALHHLREKKLSVSEVAYFLGFSEPASFSRAFKRWTGSSPRNARAVDLDD